MLKACPYCHEPHLASWPFCGKARCQAAARDEWHDARIEVDRKRSRRRLANFVRKLKGK